MLNVDLWNDDGSREFNLVRSSSGSPSISSTTPFSYSALNGGGDAAQAQYNTQMVPASRDQSSYGQAGGVGYVQDYQMQQGYTTGEHGSTTQTLPDSGTDNRIKCRQTIHQEALTDLHSNITLIKTIAPKAVCLLCPLSL